MNIKKLKKGMKVKNYKELCELLGVKVRNGSASKKKQHEEFKKYFEWKKDGWCYIITKIYNKPRVSNEEEMIELLLLHLLANNKNDDRYTIIATKRDMYEKLKMANLNYKYCFNYPDEVATYTNIPEQIVIDTTLSIDKTLEYKLLSALKKLSDKKTLFYSNVNMIGYFHSSEHRVATKEESKICIGIEGDILKELECETYNDVRFQKKEKIYNKRVKEEFIKHGIDSFYRAMEIIFIERRLPDLVEKYIHKYNLSEKNYIEYVKKVNTEIQTQTKKNANNRFENARCEIDTVIQKIIELKRKLDEYNNYRHNGFSKNTNEKELRIKMIEEKKSCEKELRKYYYRLKVLDIRSSEKYPLYTDELIKLAIDTNTIDCTNEIREFCDK